MKTESLFALAALLTVALLAQTAPLIAADSPPAGRIRLAAPAQPWTNSLGMRFVPVPGTQVLFCVWDTRVQDFQAFVNATRHDATAGMFPLHTKSWKQHGDKNRLTVNWKIKAAGD